MNEIKTLRDAANVIETPLVTISQAASAFNLILGDMDSSRPAPNDDHHLAVHFVERFPLYADTMWLIARDLSASISALDAGVNRIFEAAKAEKTGGDV